MDVTKLLDPVTGGPSLPSKGVLAIAGLILLCLALLAALVLGSSAPAAPYATASGEPATGGEPATASLAPVLPGSAAPEAGASGGSESIAMDSLASMFPAEAKPIPTAMITRIEGASEEPLEIELGLLLEAIQIGFGDRSAQLEPTLRPYVFRIAGRLSVRTDTFRIASTAPDGTLARARAATLRRLFDRAGVLDPRVILGAGSGPHALTLVSDSSPS